MKPAWLTLLFLKVLLATDQSFNQKVIIGYDDTCSLNDGIFNKGTAYFPKTPTKLGASDACNQYSESCCSGSYLDLVKNHSDFLGKRYSSFLSGPTVSATCQAVLDKLSCSVCSSNQKQFYFLSSDSKETYFVICNDFCQSFFAACGEALVTAQNQKVNQLYSRSDLFCKAFFNITDPQVGAIHINIVPYLQGNSFCYHGEKECSSHDFYTEPSVCSQGKYSLYYKYKIPKNCSGPLPAPVHDLPCDAVCGEGSFYSLENRQCLQCPPGRFSLGGGLRVDSWSSWESLPLRFSQYCLDTKTYPARRMNASECQGWVLNPDRSNVHAIVDSGPLVHVLELNAEFVHDGHIFYAALVRGRSPDVTFKFYIDDFPAYFHVVSDTRSKFNSSEFSVSQGLHNFRWEFGQFWSSSENSIRGAYMAAIREIHLVGAGYAEVDCYKCPLGTFLNVSGGHECFECSANTKASTRGSESCEPCQDNEYSFPGAASCQKRKPCQNDDIVGIYLPCHSTEQHPEDGERELVYSFKYPIICDAKNKPLPATVPHLACEECPPGFYRQAAKCVTCSEGSYYDQNSKSCVGCSAGTVAEKIITITNFHQWLYNMTTGCDGLCNLNKGWRLLGDVMDSGLGLSSFLTESWTKINVKINHAGYVKFSYNISCSSCHLGVAIFNGEQTRYHMIFHGVNTTTFPLEIGEYTITWSVRKSFFGLVLNTSETDSGVSISGIWISGSPDGGAVRCSDCPEGTYSNDRAAVCVPCRDGHSSEKKSARCAECPANSYSVSGGKCVPCGPNMHSPPGSNGCAANCTFDFNGRRFDLRKLTRYTSMYGPFEDVAFNYYFNICANQQILSPCRTTEGKASRPFACQILKFDNSGWSLGSQMQVSYEAPSYNTTDATKILKNITEAIVITYTNGDNCSDRPRQARIVIRCAPDRGYNREVIIKEHLETAPCQYTFHVESAYACHICDKAIDPFTTVAQECVNGKQRVTTFFNSSCIGGPLEETRDCGKGKEIAEVHVGVIALLVLVVFSLFVVVVVVAVKYRKLYDTQYSRFNQLNPQEIELQNAPTDSIKGGLIRGAE